MTDEVKEVKVEETTPKIRQIIIETDGSVINVIKSEVAGIIEFKAILSMLLNHLDKAPQKKI